jgi:branched-chain amino acid transport system substrate-binding protein
VVGYTAVYAIAEGLRKAGSTDAKKLAAALSGLQMESPFGRITWRAIDHQSTMGAYVGRLAKKDGRGVMVDWRYADGARYQPSDAEIRKLRKD